MNETHGLLDYLDGPMGEGLRAAEQRRLNFVSQHGEEAWNTKLEKNKKRKLEEAERIEQQRITKTLMEMSGLEEDVLNFRFDNYECNQRFNQVMFDTCQKFIAQEAAKFLFISGQPGTGKTHLGTATCNHYISLGVSTIYTTYKLLMNDLKANYNDEEYSVALRKYTGVRVLYIDDFMKEEPTKSDLSHSFELINLRYLQKKITIITSERSLDEIIEKDEALGGRIKQRCGEFAINIARKPGRDWRLKDVDAGL